MLKFEHESACRVREEHKCCNEKVLRHKVGIDRGQQSWQNEFISIQLSFNYYRTYQLTLGDHDEYCIRLKTQQQDLRDLLLKYQKMAYKI